MKRIIVFVGMITVLSVSVFAQGMTSWSSPQSTATQGRLRSAADDFIRPDAYKGVAFEKTFSMVSFANTARATLGFATKIGDVYLGTFYHGNFWVDKDQFDYTEEYTTWLGSNKVVKDYGAISNSTTHPYNQIGVLLGVGDMGFRLSLIANHDSFNDTDFKANIGGTDYEIHYLKMDAGLITPQIAWSMTKNLAEKGIKPWVTIDLGFERDSMKGELLEFDTASSSYKITDERIFSSNNSFKPILALGLGGYTLANKDGWRTSADLDYTLTLQMWNNEFNYNPPAGGNSIGSIKGTNISGALKEQSFSSHLINPSVSTQWNGEKLRLRAKLNMNVTIEAKSDTDMQSLDNGSLEKEGTSQETTTFKFNPDLRLAMQWQIASKLFLNAGGRINVNALSIATTNGSIYDDNKQTDNSSFKKVDKSFGSTAASLTLGVTLNATDNVFLEAAAGVDSGRINVFSTAMNTGLFTFANILVGLKFL